MPKIRTLFCVVDIKKRSFLPLVCFDSVSNLAFLSTLVEIIVLSPPLDRLNANFSVFLSGEGTGRGVEMFQVRIPARAAPFSALRPPPLVSRWHCALSASQSSG